MAINPLNSSNLERLALKGLKLWTVIEQRTQWIPHIDSLFSETASKEDLQLLCSFENCCGWHLAWTDKATWGSDPPLRIILTFQVAVCQQSEIVLFLLLVQRCATACQAMWHQLRRWRCSRTGSRRTCSAAAMKLFDWMTLSFPSNFIPSRTVVLAIVSTI